MSASQNTTLVVKNKRLTTFFGLKEAVKCPLTELDVSSNQLTSFEHFGTHSELQILHAEDNLIHSFLGMTKQRSLVELYVQGNPIALHPHYRVMALLTIGFSLKVIDKTPVQHVEREVARKLGPSAALAVSYGWLLDPMPRSAAEYDSIIAELRKARKHQFEAPGIERTVRTIPMVLAERSATEATNNTVGLTLTTETIELQNKALLHFSKRVAQLEHGVGELQAQLLKERQERQRLETQAQAMQQITRGKSSAGFDPLLLSVDELLQSASVTFAKSLAISTSSPSLTPIKCTVTCTSDALSVHQFFTRKCVTEVLYDDVTQLHIDSTPQTLMFAIRDGAVFNVVCDDATTFSIIHKILFQRCRDATNQPPKVSLPQEPHPSDPGSVAPPAAPTTSTTTPLVASVDAPVVSAASKDIVPPMQNVSQAVETKLRSAAPETKSIPQDSVAPPQAQPSTPIPSEIIVPKQKVEVAVPQPAPEALSRSSSSSSEELVLPNRGTKPPLLRPPENRPAATRAAPSNAAAIPPSSNTATSVQISKTPDDDSPSPVRAPAKRVAWRGKEIRELLIDSSDSD